VIRHFRITGDDSLFFRRDDKNLTNIDEACPCEIYLPKGEKMMEYTVVAQNRKARFDFHILETFEAGIVLTGTEIKSVRAGKANLREGYVRIDGGELWLVNVHISPYEQGTHYNHEPLRRRKLLMTRQEIRRLASKVEEKGLTLIPLRMYIKESRWAKIEIALAKGKQAHDKRDAVAERDANRDMARAVRRNREE
jgi:SsrA-binding protein